MKKTAWLTLDEIASLFGRDRSSIGKQVRRVIKKDLKSDSVCAKFARTATDGKVYEVSYYNLDVVTMIGNRIKSRNGVLLKEFVESISMPIIISKTVPLLLIIEILLYLLQFLQMKKQFG